MRHAAVGVIAATLLVGCGASKTTSTSHPSQQNIDQQDTSAIEQQVNTEVSDGMQSQAALHGSFVQASSTCIKQSDTAYKCLTTFTSPPGTPNRETDVTCGRNGGSCITESH